MRQNSKVVVENSSAEKQDWREPEPILSPILKSPDPGSLRIVQLGVDLGLSEGEAGDERSSRDERQLDETFPSLEDQSDLLPVRVESLLSASWDEDWQLPPWLTEEVVDAGPGG